MSTLTLTLHGDPELPIDLSPLVPERVRGLAAGELERLPLGDGLAVGDLFRVSPGEAEVLRLVGLNARCRRVGAGMASGRLEVEGEVGYGLGLGMAGGVLHLRGNAGEAAGAALRGGLLRIDGNAGDFLGGPLPGERRGQAGGTILVTGNAGARAGDRMRRGRLLVAGDVGPGCASRMLAGTVAVLGRVGEGAGLLMRRGTLLFPRLPEALPATFNPGGGLDLPVLPLLLRSLAEVDTRFGFADPRRRAAERWVGDVACGGLGEVLLLQL